MAVDRSSGQPGDSIVRVFGPGGAIAGVGVLVDERRIVTCAHVVNAALGLSPLQQVRPDGMVLVDFPMAAPHAAPLSAALVAWVPPPRAGAAGDDIAGLQLCSCTAPDGAKPARLAVEPPTPGQIVRVFGYPGSPPQPNGVWVVTTVVGRVGGGRLQLDSGPDAALRLLSGFSGSPVVDDKIGRVVGLLSEAQLGWGSERDSYAIDMDRLRLAWPEVLAGHRRRRLSPRQGRPGSDLTILHISDMQFGRRRLFVGDGPTPGGQTEDALFEQLHGDLAQLAAVDGLRPDLLVVTGDLAEQGLPSEFRRAIEFLGAVAEAAEVPRRHVAIVPGNHDINRLACAAYFLERASLEQDPVKPYWPKWRRYVEAFNEFYAQVPDVVFTPDEPWTMFEMPELNVVVAGLNSTMAESHLDTDHYGWVGDRQLRWFARRLEGYRDLGWLRLAAVHHNAVGGAALGDENLRDTDDLDWVLGRPRLVNLLLHGHTHDAKLHSLSSRLIALSTGSAAMDAEFRPVEVPNQYQLVTVGSGGFTRYARQYAPGQRRWIGDTRISPSGLDWREHFRQHLADVAATFADEAAPDDAAADTDPGLFPDGKIRMAGTDQGSGTTLLPRLGEGDGSRFPESPRSGRGTRGAARGSSARLRA
jgi:3',5'-cyclic AMP phosphodiesterase CpdA